MSIKALWFCHDGHPVVFICSVYFLSCLWTSLHSFKISSDCSVYYDRKFFYFHSPLTCCFSLKLFLNEQNFLIRLPFLATSTSRCIPLLYFQVGFMQLFTEMCGENPFVIYTGVTEPKNEDGSYKVGVLWELSKWASLDLTSVKVDFMALVCGLTWS